MNTSLFLIQTIVSILVFIFLLRFWFQYCRLDFYHPISQIIVKFTQPFLYPIRKIFPIVKNIDLSAIVACYFLLVIKISLTYTLLAIHLDNKLIYFLLGILGFIKSFGKLILCTILFRAVLSWFTQGYNPIQSALIQITEPFLYPIRKILPKTGMLDFSVMVLWFILLFLNNLFLDFFKGFWSLI